MQGSKVHIPGVTYTRDVADVGESPALDNIHVLAESKARLSYTKPYLERLSESGIELESEPISLLREKDCAVIVTDYMRFDYADILREASVIVDTRNALGEFRDEKIYSL